MKNRFWLSVALAAAGIALLAVAAFGGAAGSAEAAGAKSEARGGTLRWDSRSDWDYIDPQLAYFSHSWQMIAATGLRLMSYPDKEGAEGTRLVPEAATGFPTVSKDGLTYTFKVKDGFKFSDSKPVTASNYVASLYRALNPRMQSPAASFLEDIVGAKEYLDGKATRITGIRATKNSIVIRLKTVAPDFVARMGMEFFVAIPVNTPIEPNGIGAPSVSAGPYYVKEWVKSRSGLIVRNPNWDNSKEPWKSLGRPANVDAIQFTVGNSPDATKLRIDKNEADIGGIPPAAVSELVQKYGLNKERFFIRKGLVFWYFNLNREQALFKDNPKLAQAVAWAIDRPQIVRQHGFLGGGRTDQILPPGMPGYKDWAIYPLGGVNAASLAKAKSLATGNTRSGKATLYAFNTVPSPQIAQVVQFNLKQIGVDVDIKIFDRVVQTDKAGTRGEAFDMVHNGWGADYVDPSNFINVLLDGARIQATNNVNLSYFNDPTFNKRMQDANKLSGDARTKAYSELDRDLTKAAAVVPYINTNGRFYLSETTGCMNVSAVHNTINLVAICKK